MNGLVRHVTASLAAAAALSALGLACGSDRASAMQPAPGCTLVGSGWGPDGTTAIRVERVASGLEVPWGVAFLPGGDALLTERPGRVRLLHQGGALDPAPVATVAVSAAEGAEGGLLGIAVDPQFSQNRRFYLYATVDKNGSPVNRVLRYALSADRRSAQLEKILVDDVPAGQLHDGGRLRFGPDGKLYVATGDGRVPDRSRDPASPNGKLLRIGTDGEIPSDNPAPGSPVFLRGLRNLEAFDWLDGRTLIVADHGPSGELGRTGGDELTVAVAGADLGWPTAWRCDALAGVTSPILAFVDAMPPGGGSVYRGDAVLAWKGSFLVGTLGSQHLHRVVLGPDGRLVTHEVYLRGDPPAGLGRLRDVVEGPDGAVWVTTSNCDGRGTCPPEKDVVVRIVAGP
jgi:glucose/arabinose dehydrogenase